MNKLTLLYRILCISGALGMTGFCVYKYLRNESVVSVNTKNFDESGTDTDLNVTFDNMH